MHIYVYFDKYLKDCCGLNNDKLVVESCSNDNVIMWKGFCGGNYTTKSFDKLLKWNFKTYNLEFKYKISKKEKKERKKRKKVQNLDNRELKIKLWAYVFKKTINR